MKRKERESSGGVFLRRFFYPSFSFSLSPLPLQRCRVRSRAEWYRRNGSRHRRAEGRIGRGAGSASLWSLYSGCFPHVGGTFSYGPGCMDLYENFFV